MKTKLFAAVTALGILTTAAIPGFAASSGYSYSISGAYVNGKDVGNYHYLTSGDYAQLDGYSYYNGDSAQWADDSEKGESVTYKLYKDDSYADTYYGQVTQYVSSNASAYNVDTIKSSFTNKKLNANSSKYYLVITKPNNGHEMHGSGDINY